MAIENLLDHKCDIYHIVREDASPGYALPASPEFSYPSTPDLAAVPCHFGVEFESVPITQREPQTEIDSEYKLTLPKGTDVRLNDKIVSGQTGLEYTAGVPRNIRNHHITVKIRRVARQRPL